MVQLVSQQPMQNKMAALPSTLMIHLLKWEAWRKVPMSKAEWRDLSLAEHCSASVADSEVATETSTITAHESPSGSANDDETLRAASESTGSKSKGKGKSSSTNVKRGGVVQGADTKSSTSSTDNLVGKLNNLVTTDLTNIVEGRDFIMLSE